MFNSQGLLFTEAMVGRERERSNGIMQLSWKANIFVYSRPSLQIMNADWIWNFWSYFYLYSPFFVIYLLFEFESLTALFYFYWRKVRFFFFSSQQNLISCWKAKFDYILVWRQRRYMEVPPELYSYMCKYYFETKSYANSIIRTNGNRYPLISGRKAIQCPTCTLNNSLCHIHTLCVCEFSVWEQNRKNNLCLW